MKLSERDRSVLLHMVKYCDEIEEFVERFGDDFDVFCIDKAYKGACSLDILQIGELSVSLTPEFKEETKEIPWRDIKDMRNVVAHGYGSLDADTTWRTIKEDIPELKKFCLEKLQADTLQQKEEYEPT